jgi:hypothetical protein
VANEKISQMPDGSPLQPTDQIPFARSGGNYNFTVSELVGGVSGALQYNAGGSFGGDNTLLTDGNGNLTSESLEVNSSGATPYKIQTFGNDFLIQGTDTNAYYALLMTQSGQIEIGAGSVWWNFQLDGGLNYESATGGDMGPGTINATGYYLNGVPVATGVFTVATLPAAGNFGAAVVGFGINTVPVWSDGSTWYIG